LESVKLNKEIKRVEEDEYLKYMGSKNRIAKYILPIIMKDIKPDQWYVEPFCGGCNSLDKVQNPRIGNDINKYIVALVRDKQEAYPYLSKDQYTNIKQNPNNHPDWLVGYAGIIASYCGKWFGGYAGKVNTKDGVRDYMQEGMTNLILQLDKLRGVDFYSVPYQDVPTPHGSIIYCDPPYRETTQYKDKFDHETFYSYCRKKSKQGHYVYVSEYNMPEDFECVWELPVKSSLSANGAIGGSKVSVERLFKI
jgi:DNA adenine methylase